jgi:hypothetical protein
MANLFNFEDLKVGKGSTASNIILDIDWETGEWTASGSLQDLKHATKNENGNLVDFKSEKQGALRINIMQMAILNPKKKV